MRHRNADNLIPSVWLPCRIRISLIRGHRFAMVSSMGHQFFFPNRSALAGGLCGCYRVCRLFSASAVSCLVKIAGERRMGRCHYAIRMNVTPTSRNAWPADIVFNKVWVATLSLAGDFENILRPLGSSLAHIYCAIAGAACWWRAGDVDQLFIYTFSQPVYLHKMPHAVFMGLPSDQVWEFTSLRRHLRQINTYREDAGGRASAQKEPLENNERTV